MGTEGRDGSQRTAAEVDRHGDESEPAQGKHAGWRNPTTTTTAAVSTATTTKKKNKENRNNNEVVSRWLARAKHAGATCSATCVCILTSHGASKSLQRLVT
jgi:hypothetical protein